MSDQQYGRRAVEVGDTGKTVAENLARLRKARGLSTRQLSADLERRGRLLSPSGITRMEKAERHVTTDELVALAVVFGVSPSALLLPFTEKPDDSVAVSGAGRVPALAAWEWADGRTPLRYEPGRHPEDQWMEYELYGRPAWLRPLRAGGDQYSGEQLQAYREEGKVRGSFKWDEEGNPVWVYPRGADGASVD
ncbi:helix-turn-helix domain-containing protein [Streptomyces sp. NPDC002758]